ncbi:MAG: NAD-dependent epimerase/dehydratase family protein [Rhodomicrobiaceae bacterium]
MAFASENGSAYLVLNAMHSGSTDPERLLTEERTLMPEMSAAFDLPARILITGAGGNLGRKLIGHLAAADWCKTIIAVDRSAQALEALSVLGTDKIEGVTADLTDPQDQNWRGALGKAEAVVHFAAQNPYPDASWDDSCASLDMTLHLAGAAGDAGVRRFVFASSNHVMGRYKDEPLAETLSPGALTTYLTPGPGTRWHNGERMLDGTPYAVSKLMGERACAAAAHRSDRLTAVSVRIGWTQPGDNRPETINATGVPGKDAAHAPGAEHTLRWFRNMWLSNRDFVQAMDRALMTSPENWPSRAIIVNAMSANSAMPWDLEGARRLIGYTPEDDLWRELPASAG